MRQSICFFPSVGRRFAWLAASIAVLLWLESSLTLAYEPQTPALNRAIENFRLRDYRGAEHQLADFKNNKLLVVAFLGTECPLARLYAPRLTELEAEFAGLGVAFIGINANRQDSVTEIGHYARTHGIKFPILKDVGNVVADQFGAIRTPEVFVLDDKRVVRYCGRIDDQYVVGVQRPKPTRRDLKLALEELLADKPVSQPQTVAAGCHIGRIAEPSAAADVTYSKQIVRILQNRCVECHRPGEIAPFSLTSYAEVAGWAATIAEVVEENRMPPWHANPQHGKFINDVRLTDQEKQQIFRWVKAGAPEGDRSDLPPPREFTEGWRIPTPDQVVYMSDKPFTVKAEGEVRYQYFLVDPGFTEDKWVRAAECRPGNRAVVHHIIVAAQPPGGRQRNGDDLDSDWLVATAPGARPLLLPDGYAKKVPAGSKLIFQMHYTPNGSVQTDRSCVGLVFADPKTVRKEVATAKAATRRLEIPPYAADHAVDASYTFPHDSLMLAMFPHMHLRGKSFRYEALYPDGTREILLDVPRYDFSWQNAYEFTEPKRMPAGTRLLCHATFDNSEGNLANPNPAVTVRWGDQTWEEMMIGYFDVARADQDLTQPQKPVARRTQDFLQTIGDTTPTLSDSLKQLAAEAMSSDDAFMKFALAVQKVVPQLDRICVSTVKDQKLRFERVAQTDALRERAGGRGLEIRAAGMGLAKFAEDGNVVVDQDLASANYPDFRLLSRVFASSMHVPQRIEGNAGTINFWSRESQAFPEPAVELLKQVAAAMEAKSSAK